MIVAVSMMSRQLIRQLGFWKKEEWTLLNLREGRHHELQQQEELLKLELQLWGMWDLPLKPLVFLGDSGLKGKMLLVLSRSSSKILFSFLSEFFFWTLPLLLWVFWIGLFFFNLGCGDCSGFARSRMFLSCFGMCAPACGCCSYICSSNSYHWHWSWTLLQWPG